MRIVLFMKLAALFVLLNIFFAPHIFAQQAEIDFSNDASFDIGVYTPFDSNTTGNLVGTNMNIQCVHYFTNSSGIRSGISTISGLEGCNTIVSLPIYFALRSLKVSEYQPPSSYDSFGDFLWSLIPMTVNFNIGTNIGYGSKESNSVQYLYIGTKKYQYGYQYDGNFVGSIDSDLRFKFKFDRFSFYLSPSVSYLYTKNFTYYSQIPADAYNETSPDWFFRLTAGLSMLF